MHYSCAVLTRSHPQCQCCPSTITWPDTQLIYFLHGLFGAASIPLNIFSQEEKVGDHKKIVQVCSIQWSSSGQDEPPPPLSKKVEASLPQEKCLVLTIVYFLGGQAEHESKTKKPDLISKDPVHFLRINRQKHFQNKQFHVTCTVKRLILVGSYLDV